MGYNTSSFLTITACSEQSKYIKVKLHFDSSLLFIRGNVNCNVRRSKYALLLNVKEDENVCKGLCGGLFPMVAVHTLTGEHTRMY